MKKLVTELSGAELDYWVAKIENIKIKQHVFGWEYQPYSIDWDTWSPTKLPEQAYPIIERDRISVGYYFNTWNALIPTRIDCDMTGETALIAAMRCKVASVFMGSMSMCDIKEQWEQDVADYGDNAYLMWEFMTDAGKYTSGFNNSGIYKFIGKSEEFSRFLRRKDSAALPFDLERAKAGDAVEVLKPNGKYEEIDARCKFYQHGISKEENMVDVSRIGFPSKWIKKDNLRMKYPPKVNK